MHITKEVFGLHPGGEVIHKYRMQNDNGITVSVINFGGIVSHLYTPDKKGKIEDIVAGFDNLEGYLGDHPYFGCIVGRYANRISNGNFTLDGKKYTLAVNNGPCHLHGGIIGFDKKIWKAKEFSNAEEIGVKLNMQSPDGDEGYPGNLIVEVTYALNNKNELIIRYSAESDKPTHINLTNHSYFNLSAFKNNIYDHLLTLDADYITEVDDNSVPSGKLIPVADTPMDFRKPKNFGKEIDKIPPGYDINFVINKKEDECKLFARLEDPETGRIMEALTTEPGVQIYTANYFDGIAGKNNVKYMKHDAVCLETQHFPDSPNRPEFPSTLLLPGKKYLQTTVYRFPTK